MDYITGIYALNLPSPDGTPGDWHFSALNWHKLPISDTNESVFGSWGLHSTEVPYHGIMPVATHVRACLDMIEQGNFGTPQGMRDNFISDDTLTPTIFNKIMLLRDSPQWEKIDRFMEKEYLSQWLEYKKQIGEDYV